jgi:hypothetical protein
MTSTPAPAAAPMRGTMKRFSTVPAAAVPPIATPATCVREISSKL